MKKKIKKIISSFLPKSGFKEKIKLAYYRLGKPANVTYDLVQNEAKNGITYKTTYKNTEVNTNEALYFVAPDFDYYQHFYKIQEGDFVLDAGANCGHLSILFSKLAGESGKIVAFEPDKFNVERITKNLALNPDLSNNISIEELLLWNQNTFLDFEEAGTVASSAIYLKDAANCVKKEAVTIDDWVAKNHIQKIDFIKMDIEGAEIEALEGCVNTIKNLAPNFAIASYHYVDGKQTYEALERFFEEMKYPFKTVKFRKDEIITFAGPLVKTDKSTKINSQ